MKIPVQRQTVDITTGESTTETVHLDLLPPPPGTCSECGKAHGPDEPHDAQSLHYQYHHYGRTGRWPNWLDAMAHCTPEMQAAWTEALERAGVDVQAGHLGKIKAAVADPIQEPFHPEAS